MKKLNSNNKINWKEEKGKLVKDFEFKNFVEALEFVNKVGKIAEKLQHHPDINIYDYKKVKIATSTHETGTITEKDYLLSKEIDKIG